MLQSNKLADFLETVRQQIRWKRAHPSILEELENHIVDQRDALRREGLDEDTALRKAITEMGDPVLIGQELDRAHRPKPDWPLLAMTAILIISGLTIQFILSTDVQYGVWYGSEILFKQSIWVALAVMVFLMAYFLDFTILGRYSFLAYFLILAIVIGSFLFSGKRIYGNYTAIYPLLLIPTIFAGIIYKMRNQGYWGIILCGVAVIIPTLLVSLIPNATVVLLISTTSLIIMTFAIVKGWFKVKKIYALLIVYLSSVFFFMIYIFGMLNDYTWHRVQRVLNISLDPNIADYSSVTIRKLLLHSRLWGEGMPIEDYGQSSIAQVLPEIHTDYILAYLTYKSGWIMFLAITLIFLIFMVRSAVMCKKQKNTLGRLVSFAIILTFAFQFLIYVVANLGFVLLGPVSLPLISYGGRAMVVNMCLIGFLLSVFRTGNLIKDKVESGKSKALIQYKKGKLIINLKILG